MNQSDYFNQCRQILRRVLKQLDCEINDHYLNNISQIIVDTMGGNHRYFHTFDHILMVSKSDDPLIILAALFHDLVYLQVDQQIRFNLASYLNPFIQEINGNFFLNSTVNKQEKELDIVLQIFNLNRGDNLSSFRGINEFISALSAAIILSSYLPLKIITRLITIIELTIPFREVQANQLSIIEQLKKR